MPIAHKRKRKFKRFFYIVLIFFSLIFGSLIYFFVSTKAPIIYGEVVYHIEYNSNQTLDLYYPTTKIYEKSPVIVFFHGGAWIAGRKESINFNRFNQTINQLREQGYTIISPSYTLAKEEKSPFPSCIHDAYDVLNWLDKNAVKYNLDTDNIGVFGESAGAHIAMMCAITNPNDLEYSTMDVTINYIVNVYGPSDLQSLYEMQHTDSFNLILSKVPSYLKSYVDFSNLLIGFEAESNQEKSKIFLDTYSPINHFDQNSPPILIIHGSDDQVVPIEQSILLKSTLDSLNIENEFKIVEGADHAFIGANKEQLSDVQYWITEYVLKKHHSVK